MSLEDLRRKIDETDTQIVRLIAERIRISEEIGEEKKRQESLALAQSLGMGIDPFYQVQPCFWAGYQAVDNPKFCFTTYPES